MTRRDPAPSPVDTTRPNVARIYDYLLGGKDNFAADREAAARLIEASPDMPGIVRNNRAFIGRAVRFIARDAGVRQFIDLGGGLPTQTNVHEMAQQVIPDARVVYVDNDPVVWSHGQALLADGSHVVMVHADPREPEAVLRNPDLLRLLDLSQPVALVCACVLHFVPDEEKPHQVMAEYRDQLASGSYLVISHGTAGTPEDDPEDLAGSVTSVFRQASAQLHVRSLPEIQRFFDGFDLLDPGVTCINDWRPDPDAPPAGRPRSLRGGVGRKR